MHPSAARRDITGSNPVDGANHFYLKVPFRRLLWYRWGLMATKMRAKVSIISVEKQGEEHERLSFRGVPRSDSYPEDGSDENNTFAKFSPSVDIGITIANPALIGEFKQGDTFYLDFVPVPPAEPKDA